MKNVFDSVRFNNKPSKGSNLGFVFFLMLIASSQIVFAQPDTLWTKIHSGQVIADGMHVEQTTDGGFIITGRVSDVEYTNNIWLIKTDAIGDTLWTKRYFPTGSSNGNSVIQTSDGGYIIAGNHNTSPNNISDGIIIKTNSTGDTLWTLNLGAYANSESLSDISQISSGGYIAVGSKDSDIWLVKINTSGDTLWTRTFGSTSYSESGTSVIESSSGGFIITGMTYENNRDIILIKTDASGNSAWSKQFGTSNEPEQGYDLVELSDGSLAITGYTNSNGAGASDVWLIKTNSSGDTLWTKTFGGGYSDYGYSIGKTNDGGLILTGRFQPSNNDNSDVYIIKTDTIGNKIWEKKIGGSDTDYGMSIQQTSDGGYIVVGTTESFGTYGSVYLIRISSDPPPTVPTNLTTTSGNEQVTLRWNANTESDLAKYRIYRDTSSPASTLIDSVVGSPPDTTFTNTGLTNGQIYYYRITAVDNAGNESGYSSEVSATPQPPPPTANFTAAPTSGTVPLTVNFTDQSTNTPTSWLWLFGDGKLDTTQNPSHVYTQTGTYNVRLVASHASGSDDTVRVALIQVTAEQTGNLPATVDLNATPSNVTRIYGDDAYDNSGISVSTGDINGDGFFDVIIGAYKADPTGGSDAGETYIVYGANNLNNTTSIDLNGTPSNVTRIYGDDIGDNSGISVSTGDINGDGFFDVIIGAYKADPTGGSDAGETYIVYGSSNLNNTTSIDLNSAPSNVTRIYGEDAGDWSGISVSTGDINGDGFFDVIIGARFGDSAGGTNAGETYIVYGSSNLNNTTSIDLDTTLSNVTRIYGDDNSDYSGYSVSTGDINGDGFFDVIIGAHRADPAGGTDAGETYIVYGSSNLNNTTSIDLNGTPSNVTRIYGDDAYDESGYSVSTGDINGDGFFDVIIGAYAADPAGGSNAGETYIVYGSSNLNNTTSIDLNGTPSNVTRIYGDDANDNSGYSVSTGDINGDGFFDVIIGANRATPAGGSGAGETYIVYGSSNWQNTTSIDLNGTPSNVTRIYGDNLDDRSGTSVATGDINGDGVFDVIIGAYTADPAGGQWAGETYVIYGGIVSSLSGTYTIGNGGDFTSFSSAVDSLNSVGVSGPVTFNVLNGTYTEQIEIGVIAGVSATDTIIFQSQSGVAAEVTLTYAATGSSDNWVVKLNGANYVTFQNMTLSATGASYARVFNLTGDADNNTITNNILTGKSTTSSSTNYAVIYSFDSSVDNTTISNNTLVNGSHGVFLEGVNSSTLSQGSKVENNTFTDQGYRAVYLEAQDAPVINGNTITSSDGAMDFGIYAYYCDNSLQIKKNRISGIDGASVQLINCSGTAVSNGLVANNFVEGEGTSYADGIEIVGSSYQNIYYNSVNIPSVSTTNRALNIQSGSNINVKNNIFTTPGGGYAYYTSQPSAIASSDYNDLYSTGNYVAHWGSSDLSDLSTLQSASGMDANSVSVNPRFTSNIDLHTTTTWLDSLGTPLASVTDDIDGETRDGTYPDIGADEFTAVGTTLAGTKTIGASGNYATFNEAIDSLTTFGVSGPVTFNVASGTYTEQIEIGSIPGVNATNTITFQSQSGTASDVTLTFAASGSSDNWVVKLNGADYITFRNMTLSATGTSFARVFNLTGNADNNTITGCTLVGKSTTSSSDNYAIIYSFDSSVDNTTISNNTFLNGGTGVYLNGVSNTLSQGLKVENNTFTDQGYRAVYLEAQKAPVISTNIITSSNGSLNHGIYAYYCDNGMQIQKNHISGGKDAGIIIAYCDGTTVASGLIANNFIQVGGTSTAYGIYLTSSTYQNIYHNSVNITSTYTTHGRALYTTGGSNINVKNNIFANNGGGYAYYVNNTSAITSSDYNDLYSPGNFLAYWDGDRSDLSALQSASGKDDNSIFVNPNFISDSDLHTTTTWLDSLGISLATVIDDIDGESRDGNYPDIGADEFTGLGTPLGGNYVIAPAGGGSYSNLTDAVSDLIAFGVSSWVSFTVIGGTLNEQITLTPVAGASATNTITFKSQSGDSTSVIISYSASNSDDNFVVKLNGADYITFRDMTLAATGAGDACIFDLVGNADNNTISNNVISGNSSAGSSSNYALIFSENQSADNMVISNNILVNGSYGLFIEGISSSNLSSGTQVTDNTFTDQYYRGVYLRSQDAPIVESNSITTSSTSSSFRAVYTDICDNSLKIQKNRISGGRGTGIYLEDCDGTFTAQGLIANNFIQVGGTSTAYGIRVDNSYYQNIYYNSVNITSTSTSAGRALYSSSGGNLNLTNNIFTNMGGGYAYYIGTPSAIATSNYNNFYATGTNLAYWGSAQTDLAALQTASGMETNSISSDPGFESTTDLHVTITNDVGTPLTEVTDDIDGEPRDAVSPDAGADEFYPANYDGIIEVPGEIATIQGAIDVAVNGDSIKVSPGTYVENINFNGKNIIIVGEDRETTIIDGNQNGSVVTFNSGENSEASLSGFTITNGSTNQTGGGIYCGFASPTIENCIIKGNTADSGGGISINVAGANPTLLNLIIKENTAVAWGGGIQLMGQATGSTIEHCIIQGNIGAGLHIWDGSHATIKFSEISNNSAEGIFFNGQTSIDIINSTITNNSGYGLYLHDDNIQTPNIINSIIYGNTGQQIYSGDEDTLNISYSNVADSAWAGDGNVDVEPLFVDTANDDYRLLASSMLINAGHVDSTDSDGTRADIGAYPYLNSYTGPDWYISTTGDDTTGTGTVDDPFASIQAGIQFATTGDSVSVAAGTYIENINFRGRNIKVFGEDRETTIIDGNQNGSVVTFNSGETSAAVLSDFTIQNGNGINLNDSKTYGGGIFCSWSNPTLANLVVSANTVNHQGGGIYCISSNPSLENITISGNTATYSAGGIFCSDYSNLSLKNVTITGNEAGSDGGGISCSESILGLENVTISGNSAASGGGIFCANNANLILVNTILWNNTIPEIYFWDLGSQNSITISYSDIQGGLDSIVTNNSGTVIWGAGNIDADPLFVDAANSDFNLTSESPVIDAGDPDSQYNDPDGTIADMGAYYYDQTGQPARVQRLVTTPGTDNIVLKWDANSEANLSSYNVYRSTTAGANFSSVASVAIPDTEYVDNTVYPDVTYYYRIGAVDTDSNEGLLALEEHGRIALDSSALNFVSVGDFVEVNNIPSFLGTGDHTVELWVQPVYTDNGFPYERTLIERTDFILSLSSPAAGELFAELTVGAVTLTGTTTLIDEEWHHIAVVINSSANTIRLWVDGYLESNVTGSSDGSGVFRISAPGLPFDGVVDEVRVSDVLRYTGGFIPPREFTADANTIGLWHFNEGATDATTPALYDISGHGAHGVINGAPVWVDGPPFLSDDMSPLVINEIMQNPAAVSDAVGEWIEIHNQGFVPIHFDGWTLKDDGSDNHFISVSEFQEPPQVLPGDYVVLGINADTTVNGGVEVDYQYTGFSLTNAEDEVILMDGMDNEIDRVSYDGGSNFPGPNGKSMELITPYLNNNQGTNWTEAIRSYGGGDLGSPGRRNDAYSGQIVVADTLLNFGGVVEGMESLLSLVIHNTGVNELVIDTIFTQTGEFSPNPIGAVIGIGDSLTVNVTFMPTNPGDFVDLLTISSDDPLAHSVTVALQGYGINELQDIVVTSATDDSVSAINFPLTRIVSSREMTLTLTNVGSAVLEIDEITITGDNAFSVDVTDVLLPLNDSVVVTVTFDPSVEGDYSAVLSFSSNDPDEGFYAVQLTGTGSQYIVLFVPSEYSTIQTALDTAFSGDTVQVAAGTYFENIAFADSNLVLHGAGPGLSIIDGSSSGSVVTITGLDSTTILEGFTIQNGSATQTHGGGIKIEYSSPTLRNLVVTGNSAAFGGGISCWDNSSPSLENVRIIGNAASAQGSGIYLGNSSPSLENVTISSNNGGSGGIHCQDNSKPILVNTILWNNSPQEVYFNADYDPNSITLSYSDIQGGLDSIITNDNGTVNWGDGNIDADPLFVDAEGGDFHLQWESSAIDAGDPSSPQDLDGTVADMGVYSYNQSYQPPDPPTNLAGLSGNGQATITWSPPTDPRGNLNGDITGYIVYSGLQSNTLDSLAYVISDDTTYTDMGTDGHLINGETYRYYIVAIDTSDLYGVPSDTISVIPVGGTIVLADTLHDFGQFDHNETGSWDLIMENTGNGALNLSDISTATSWFTVSDDTLTIPVGSTDTVRVTFWTDFTSGVVNDTITITSDDLNHPTVQIALSAESVWPVVDLSATELPFGDVKVYQPMTVPLTLFNDGTDTLFVDSIFVTTDTVFTVTVASGQTSLALLNRIKDAGTLIQKSVYPAVRNERIGETGNQRREIGRKSLNDLKQKTTNRLGRLSTPPRHAAQARRAGNNRSGDSNRAGTDIIGQITPNMTSIRISSNILPGDTLTLDITFFTSDTGSFVSELRITSDDPVGNSDILVPLSARSIAPVISLSANALDFGNAWNGDSLTVNITNIGTDTLHIVDISVSDNEFTAEITATNILPNATTDLTVHFAPPGTGYWEGSLIISSDAYLLNQVNMEMKAIALPTGNYDLGQVLLNRDSIQVSNYDNGGNTTLVVDSLITTNSAFSVQLNSNSIAPGQTLQITTSFSPPDKSIYQADEILYTSQIGDGFTIAQLSGEGITYPQSNFSTKSLSVVTYRGNDTQFSFDLSNSGDFPLDYSIDVDADWFGFIWLELINTEGLVTGLSTNTILVNVVNMANLDPGTVAGRLYFNTNSGTTPTQIVRTDTVEIFLNLLADDTQLASGSAVISTGNPDPVNVLDDENNPIGLMLDFITSSGGTVNVLRVDAYPPIDSTTTYFDPSGLITSPVYAYEYFEITSDIQPGYTVHVGFDYTHLPGILDESKLRLARRVNNAGTAVPWDIVDISETEIDTENGLIIARNQTQFSQWVLLSNTGENLFLDVLAPAFGVPGYTPESPGIMENIVVTIPITDESGIASANLFYAEAGEWNYSEIAMVENSGEFSATIPGTMVTHSGVVYFITATDLLDSSSVSDTMGVEINFPNNDISTSSVNGSAYSSGYPSEKWRMLSIPAALDNNAVTNVIGDELGSQTDDIWRLFRYDANNQTYQDKPSNFNYGEGYWLYQTVENNLIFAATSGQTGNLDGSSIILKPLWNLIACPYPFPVSVQLDDILFYGPITYGQDGEGWTGEVSELKPWNGYAVYNRTGSDQTILIDPIPQPGMLAKEQIEEGWLLNLSTTAGEYTDLNNPLGCLVSAKDGLDYHDNPELLAPGNYLSLTYTNPSWGNVTNGLTSDIRKLSEDVQIWDVSITRKGISDLAYLTWNFTQSLPAGQVTRIVDLARKIILDTQVDSDYKIGKLVGDFPYKVKVIAGYPEQVDRAIEDIIFALPNEFTLAQNYPNPFNPVTTLKFGLPEPRKIRLVVVNILGQEIVDLANGWYDLGYHQIRWDSRDNAGQPVASGVYFAILTDGKEIHVTKMIMLK